MCVCVCVCVGVSVCFCVYGIMKIEKKMTK